MYYDARTLLYRLNSTNTLVVVILFFKNLCKRIIYIVLVDYTKLKLQFLESNWNENLSHVNKDIIFIFEIVFRRPILIIWTF